jgi:hypothetical protein
MNQLQFGAVVGLASLAFFAPGLRACDNRQRCQPNVPRVVPAPIRIPGNRAAPLPPPSADPEGGEDSVVWDLPDGTKSRTAKRPAAQVGAGAVRPRTAQAIRPGSRPPAPATPPARRVSVTERDAARPPSRPAEGEGEPQTQPARSEGGSYNDRVVQAVAAQQALAAENARLGARLAELERWDTVAQDKFRRAFGTADERVRQLVFQRIEQRRERNQQLIAALADGLNLEFYMRTKKPR